MRLKNKILTACNSLHFRNVCQFIYSYRKKREHLNSGFICYDIGLTDSERSYLEATYPEVELRVFDFTHYPEFVRPELMTYSWKPLIIAKTLHEKKGSLLWMDSASIILKPLQPIWEAIGETGSYFPVSGTGTLAEWTHPATLQYLNVPEKYYSYRNRCGCMCGFSYNNAPIRGMVDEWARLALIKECIKPEGANRANHRDDQSLLTILLYRLLETTPLSVTTDEVNISSPSPIKLVSVRNKVPPWWPLGLNSVSIAWFLITRKLDISINRLKRR